MASDGQGLASMEVFCRECRALIGDDAMRFRRRPGRCAGCHVLVAGTNCEVPTWIYVAIGILAIRMQVAG